LANRVVCPSLHANVFLLGFGVHRDGDLQQRVYRKVTASPRSPHSGFGPSVRQSRVSKGCVAFILIGGATHHPFASAKTVRGQQHNLKRGVCDGNRAEPPFEYALPPPFPIVQPDWNTLLAAFNEEATVSPEEIFRQWLTNIGMVFMLERFKAERIATMQHVHMWTDELLKLVPVRSAVHRKLLLEYAAQGYNIDEIVETILQRRRDSR